MSASSHSLKKAKVLGKISIPLLGVLVLAIFATMRRSGETITFHIVDRSMQLPLTNVSVVAVQKWTILPTNRLGLPGFSAWFTNRVICRNGSFTLPVSQREMTYSVSFKEGNHLGAIYYAGTAWTWPRIQYAENISRNVDTKGDIVIQLKRRFAIDGSAFGSVIDQ